MPRIVNLSSLHTLHPISSGVEGFAKLCDKYSSRGCFSFCPSIFTKLTSKAWVAYKYQKNLNTLINPYKLGKISTQEFLARLLEIFNFLEDDRALLFMQKDRCRIESNRDDFISTRGIQHLSNHHIALALLEEAWNNIIAISDADQAKFEHLLEQSNETPTYLISNTNELNVDKILGALKKGFPDVKWKLIDLSISNENPVEPLEVAPNLFLYLSYKAHTFKTASENRKLNMTTPSLLRSLVNKLDADKADIKVISQYGKDLEEAEKLGIPKSNLQTAKDYFPESVKGLRYAV